MKKIKKKFVDYLGVENPKTKQEVEIECLGLETVISFAKNRIAILKQALYINSNEEGDDDKENK